MHPYEDLPLLLYCTLASCVACILATYQYCADHELHMPVDDAAQAMRVRARLYVLNMLQWCTLLSCFGHLYTLVVLTTAEPATQTSAITPAFVHHTMNGTTLWANALDTNVNLF